LLRDPYVAVSVAADAPPHRESLHEYASQSWNARARGSALDQGIEQEEIS